jgi:hypothetical protein
MPPPPRYPGSYAPFDYNDDDLGHQPTSTRRFRSLSPELVMEQTRRAVIRPQQLYNGDEALQVQETRSLQVKRRRESRDEEDDYDYSLDEESSEDEEKVKMYVTKREREHILRLREERRRGEGTE